MKVRITAVDVAFLVAVVVAIAGAIMSSWAIGLVGIAGIVICMLISAYRLAAENALRKSKAKSRDRAQEDEE